MSDKQIQKAGDNSQQIQAGTVIIQQGITEERARAIYSEMSLKTRDENTVEASLKAIERIDRLENLLIPRIEKEDKIFECFADPAFQILLRKVQMTAVCTDREDDYKILSELLVHRIKNKKNIKKKASISKAVEIIDQIDDDSLCALTLIHAMTYFLPLSGNISDGLLVLADLYNKLNYEDLPTDKLWLDNVAILGCITIVPFFVQDDFEDRLFNMLDGYSCVGILKSGPAYQTACELLENNKLDKSILIDHELNDGYVRLAIPQKGRIDSLSYTIYGRINGMAFPIERPLSAEQKKCLHDIFDLYAKDATLQNQVKQEFVKLLLEQPSIEKVIKWWNGLNASFSLTSIGKVIAHANAKRIDNNLPDLD